MGLLYGYRCPECGSDQLLDASDVSTTDTKAVCSHCDYFGVLTQEGGRRP
jgi:predicted RNA-binding Zn-ribbon protein involved in translation (DUF1610 family)